MASTVVLGMLGLLMVLLLLGIHIAVALMATSVAGVALLLGNWQPAITLMSTTAFQFLRDYIFAVIPLYILMGDLVARSGAALDLFTVVNRGLRGVPGRLGVATVVGNAIFAAVTGVSIAAAAAFSRFAFPAMAVGSIAGSAVLGMLIPPSILMIVWAILTEVSIGRLFVAGVLPGILLSALFCAYIMIKVWRDPAIAPEPVIQEEAPRSAAERRSEKVGFFGIVALILVVLGGIWFGAFTPTEAAAVGALGALALGLAKGMTSRDIFEAVYQSAKTTAPILILLIAAQMYSRMLSMGGVIGMVQSLLAQVGLEPLTVLLFMTAVWLVLGCIIDSTSIMLLTVPIFGPVAASLGFDPIAFAIYGILIIEAGLLTPPFGMLVYTVRGSLPDRTVTLGQIFAGSMPYCALIVLTAALVWIFPGIATWLPSFM
jgi:C4-dicarboxylate transporter, DctM subunit